MVPDAVAFRNYRMRRLAISIVATMDAMFSSRRLGASADNDEY
jgi:hypothetical protein